MKRVFMSILVIVFLGMFLPAVAQEPSVQISPEQINIDFFYHGQQLRVSGTVPENCQVVLKVEGARQNVTLTKKDKRGPLWMSVGTVAIEAPTVYLLFTSCGEDELKKYNIGIESLPISSLQLENPPQEEFLRREFIRLKEHQGLYRISPKSITPEFAKGSGLFSTTVDLPVTLGPGDYTAELLCFSEDKMVGKATAKLHVQKVGLVRLISEMAFTHGACYGVVAVLVALLVGFTIGKLFKSKRH